MDTPYTADRSLYGKLRRRLARVVHARPAQLNLTRPLLTVSFDDAPSSAADAGAAILERHGARGTWFISAGLMGQHSHLGTFAIADEIRALAAAGHEIACHTHDHIDCGKGTGEQIAGNLDLNAAAFQREAFPEAATFAYPYGDVSPQAKAILRERFTAARALHHGLIITGTDLNQAPAVGIEGADGEDVAQTWLRRAVDQTAWLVLYTHDVRETPSSWGCTPAVLDRLVTEAVQMGFEIVTFAEGARRATPAVVKRAA
ncbi:polysaccharide deacetylase family protein [Asticcacaulis sp. 201]|uniref:polysaccharide deacetylase family protein n=1 Tax=Asticcacaulis sp. 201 TaxID=3028787 RepID=UPI00291623D0|nr:polysaccharide deacetylase family protein [Asticcacaulis sp. 201]MDV6332819.1 polysaccharide deacetylase family protein [Asticcacaulis sp. 201]